MPCFIRLFYFFVVCRGRQHGIASSTFYKWKAKYGGMEASDVKRLKELEEENRRLKQMYADLSLKSQLQAEIIKKR